MEHHSGFFPRMGAGQFPYGSAAAASQVIFSLFLTAG